MNIEVNGRKYKMLLKYRNGKFASTEEAQMVADIIHSQTQEAEWDEVAFANETQKEIDDLKYRIREQASEYLSLENRYKSLLSVCDTMNEPQQTTGIPVVAVYVYVIVTAVISGVIGFFLGTINW